MHVSQIALLSVALCMGSSSAVAQVEHDRLDTASVSGSDVIVERTAELAIGRGASWRIDDTLCNPRVRVCENPPKAPEDRSGGSRVRALDLVLCNPRVRLCEAG